MRVLVIVALAMLALQTSRAVAVTFDGGVTNQAIDGFGANVNYRGWNNDELKPVIDALMDQAGMTLFRVIYDTADWEKTNDNANSSVFEWTNYNAIYSSAEFTKLWDMMAYLNQRGITNGAFFNFMGWGPSWMMQSDVTSGSLKSGMESEWAEMITSLLVYARNTRGLQFNLVAPDNEPDLDTYPEGIHITTATQYTNALHQLALRLDSAGMGDVGLVGPDLSTGGTTYMPQIMADPVIMAKLKHFGMHNYNPGGAGSAGVRSYILGSAYPNRTFWMTEYNVWCAQCEDGTSGTNSWSYARGTAEYLLAHLSNGASGSQVWEAYDSKYAHGAAYNGVSGTNKWSYWGLLGVDNPNAAVKTYTPRKQFYTYAQISKWVRPGAQRINVTGSAAPLSPLLAFKHIGLGQISIVGINTSASAATLSGTLASLPSVSRLDLYYTSATANLAAGSSSAVNANGTFSAIIPADCVFTLVSAGMPVATNMVVGVLEDTGTNLTLLGGGGTVSYAILTNPTNGTLGTLNTNTGGVAYTPNTNYFGADYFRFTVSAGGLQATGAVSLTISAVNDVPVAFGQNVTNGEDISFAITLTGSDVDGPVTNYAILSGPTNGILSGAPPNLMYRGATNYFGPDSFTFSVNDGSLTSAVATVTIMLTNINDAPMAVNQSITNGEDTSFAITLTGSDADGPLINYVVLVGPTSGTLSGTPPNLTYRGATNYFGPDSFTFSVNDGSLTGTVATVTIMLTNLNDAPMAFDQSVTNGEDTSIAITLTGSDVDGPETNYAVLVGPTNGTLSGAPPNLMYRGATNYFGPDSFTFSVNDGSLTSAAATVTILLTNINDAPVAFDQSVTNGEDTSFAITLTGSDVDGPQINCVVLVGPTSGTLSGTPPNLTYRGATNYFGPDSFTFSVNDGSLTGTVATVTILLTNINDAPVAFDQSVTNLEDTSLAITLTGSDVDGPETNYVVLAGPTNGTLSGVAPNLTYLGASNYFGPDSFTFSIDDGGLTSAVATVSITVLPVNHPPVANDDHYDLDGSVALDIPGPGVLNNDSDPEGDTLIATLVTGPLQGVLNLSPGGWFSYTPTNHFSGVDTFTYQASDGQTNSGVATVSIAVSNLVQIVSVGLSNDLVTVIWTSIVGKEYRLQFKPSWADPDWTDIAPDIRASGTTAIGTNAVEAVSQRIYRVLDVGP
jgi:hypothetical protein